VTQPKNSTIKDVQNLRQTKERLSLFFPSSIDSSLNLQAKTIREITQPLAFFQNSTYENNLVTTFTNEVIA
jgi:hypothetical protein